MRTQPASLLSLGRKAVRWIQPLLTASERDPGATILAYHLVGAGTNSVVDLPSHRFRHQMEELKGIAEVVPLAEVTDGPARRASARPRVALTFDDAYANFHGSVWPVLQQLQLPATLFVPVGFIEKTIPPPIAGTDGLAPCSWSQLSEMSASTTGTRVEIGSHTYSHADLPSLDERGLRHELADSKTRLQDRLETRIPAFCYPRARWHRRVEKWVSRVYDLAVVGGGRKVHRGTPPLRLSRISIRRDMPDSLVPLLRSSVWLEEWLADRLRRWRMGRRQSPSLGSRYVSRR